MLVRHRCRGIIISGSLTLGDKKMGNIRIVTLMDNQNGERKDLAADYLSKYIQLEDSARQSNEEHSISEFATLVNMEKLNSEKKELMLQAQKKELYNKQILIISLAALLIFVFIFLY